MKKIIIIIIVSIFLSNCKAKQEEESHIKPKTPFIWEGANIYFLLTDRFNNGDISNDINFNRTAETGKLRGFKGGDIKGVTQKIKAGYFTDLGINAIWMTPIVEQIHGGTDEGTGLSYGFHGYWTRDWTALDPNFGTKEDLHELVEAAHRKGIRIVLDAVINHTGPVTDRDPVWPENWVRTGPKCDYQTYDSTITCTLVDNLPDIKTETDESVSLPNQLIEKWKKEGRYEQEIAELNDFFNRTGYPRAPRFYIIKWLADYITEFGIDGYRADTVKHTEAYVWQEFKTECDYAFAEWKKGNPDKVLDNNNFYLVGEVYNYGISTGQYFDFGDKKVNYFDNAFQGLINFQFKWHAAQQDYETLFKSYSNYLTTYLKGFGTLNYVSSHDDGKPYDASREKPFDTATKLLLSPGASQVYYGDESARSLIIEGTEGDATLRSFMNWNAIKSDAKTKKILSHWQKLGQFRANHPAVGAGIHQMITHEPYLFYRSFSKNDYKDLVVVGLDLPIGEKILDVSKLFNNDDALHDAYSNQNIVVKNGKVIIDSEFNIVLLEKK
ncbi:alpha-amylase family glycosyl hydrolase [Flavivirga spongiicola]|uniref:Alpha-amylase family glycosyl hydrolase n=1 Tax=Flavivirga spongiicola TaxID=421621 RepID=A0ABU7XQJ8_9FLAO|nr:alpha-amylase family glycosyl hydrolase [Flavivirga sp. MEBiC05379]MDO5977806.1 alpha-amylase family glycosyl hydrolase [Flavivirga sp. MEBiC05379]